jgi:hypothetical protein
MDSRVDHAEVGRRAREAFLSTDKYRSRAIRNAVKDYLKENGLPVNSVSVDSALRNVPEGTFKP